MLAPLKGFPMPIQNLEEENPVIVTQCKSERRCLAAVTSPRRTGWENNERIKSTRMETSRKTKELWRKKVINRCEGTEHDLNSHVFCLWEDSCFSAIS